MPNPAILYTRIRKIRETLVTDEEDMLAAEEPLEIKLVHGPAHNRQQQSLTVTMRTPGEDHELAAGFLYTEGIIRSAADIADIHTSPDDIHTIQVSLQEGVRPVLQSAQRNFYANSGCGVCGKADVASIFTPVQSPVNEQPLLTLPVERLLQLPEMIRDQQPLFDFTGGIHAAALFNTDGELLFLREDIGRHNAVDKLIGAALLAGHMPLHNGVLLLSGRAGFELIQKAAMAGIPIIAAVGAPSGMAVKMAQQWNITLVGFLRQQRCNIYTKEERIVV
ncbi:formate dehydrogenase accessory sulfurtransferase FdhD [Chitinophaga agrisoli]|uniref:Sulfur carrier protein FdhD n=2 Tax=Chitinophaga agrisoli TaxID=2607653 RepID=A0A5B2VQE9_9BACT|nr:formate dehydrogenase accessory sulfurtransferase FdhD [Chitinophaga agrisoli]